MRILIYGSGTFGRLMRRHVELCGHEFEGFVDDGDSGPDVLGDYAAVRERLPPSSDRAVIVAVGFKNLETRWRIACRLREDGYSLPALTHTAAWVHPDAQLADGVLVGAGVTIDAGARIGTLSALWPGVIISHDARIGENTWLSPGAIVCGFARVGAHTFVGAGAVVPDNAVITGGSFVRAGSVTARSPT